MHAFTLLDPSVYLPLTVAVSLWCGQRVDVDPYYLINESDIFGNIEICDICLPTPRAGKCPREEFAQFPAFLFCAIFWYHLQKLLPHKKFLSARYLCTKGKERAQGRSLVVSRQSNGFDHSRRDEALNPNAVDSFSSPRIPNLIRSLLKVGNLWLTISKSVLLIRQETPSPHIYYQLF